MPTLCDDGAVGSVELSQFTPNASVGRCTQAAGAAFAFVHLSPSSGIE